MIESFDNTLFLKFSELSDEHKLFIIEQKQKNNVESYVHPHWSACNTESLSLNGIYRTKLIERTLNIPWEYIENEWQYAALDRNGAIYLYTLRPEMTPSHIWNSTSGCPSHIWNSTSGCETIDASFLLINTDGVDWDKSLTKRP